MKRAVSILLMASLGFATLVLGCGDPFSRVTITGGPSLYAPLGTTDFVLSDYFSAANISEMLSGATGAPSFEYRDPAEPEVLKMMLRYPIADVSVDFSEYLESVDFISTMEQTIPLQQFTVPDISIQQNQTINLSLLSEILDQINSSYAPIPLTMPESSIERTVSYDEFPPVEFSCPAFASVSFSAGTFDFSFEMQGASAGAQLFLTSMGLYDGTGTELTASGPIDLDLSHAGAVLNLPLTGVTLPSTSYLRFSFRTSGGFDGNFYTLNISPQMSSDTAVSGGTGIDFSWDLAVPDIVIPLGVDSTFSSALISAGSIDFTIPALGPDYVNFGTSLDLAISQPTGLFLSAAGSTAVTTSFDLAGQTITGEDITATAVYHVNAVDASFSNYPSPGLEITCTADAEVLGFTTMTVLPGTSLDLSQTFTEPLDPQIAQWVDSIDFTEVGISVSLTNGLPAGNDIGLAVQSTIFGIDSSGSFPGGSATPIVQDYLSTSYTLNPASFTDVDFSITSTLSGYDSGSGLLTLSNLTTGATYSIEGSVSVVADWSSLTLSADAATTSGVYPETGGIDLSFLSEYLGDGIEFSSIPAYLYLSGIDSLSADMRLSASYTLDSLPTSIYLVGTEATPQAVASVDPLDLPLDENGVYVGSIPSFSQEISGLASVFNAHPADLTLAYDFSMGSMVITPAEIDAGARLSAELLIVLPFELSVTDPEGAPILLDSFLGDFLSQDIFQRTADGDNSTIDMLLDSLSSMSLTLDIVNDTGLSLNASFTHGTAIDIPLDLSLPSQTLSLDEDDILYIKETIPFSPTISVRLPPGTWALRNDAGITVSVSVTAVSDFEQTFELGGEE